MRVDEFKSDVDIVATWATQDERMDVPSGVPSQPGIEVDDADESHLVRGYN